MHRFAIVALLLLITVGSSQGSADAPTIQMFVAYPPEIVLGGTSSLVWEVSGSTSIRIEPSVGEATGPFVMVQPLATTTYTLSASNDAGSATATVTVTVVTGSGEDEGNEEADHREDCPAWEGAEEITGALTLTYSGSGQGDPGAVSLERQADLSLTFAPTPHGHWESTAIAGSARIHDSYTSPSLSDLIAGEGTPNPETSTLRLDSDCTLSARVVVSLEAENSTVSGVATSTVAVVYLEGVAASGEAELKAHVWHFGGESGVSLTQGQSYVDGFGQDLGMILGQDALGNARVTWSFTAVE